MILGHLVFSPTPCEPVTSIRLERREPVHNRQRFYVITVTRTLFGSWAMVREWGRIGHPGTVREMWFETEGEACEAGEQWRQWKEKRGYHAVGREAKSDHRNGNHQNVMT